MTTEPPKRPPRLKAVPPLPKKLRLTRFIAIPFLNSEIVRKIGVRNLKRSGIITLAVLLLFLFAFYRWEIITPPRHESDVEAYYLSADGLTDSAQDFPEIQPDAASYAPRLTSDAPLYTPEPDIVTSRVPNFENIALPPSDPLVSGLSLSSLGRTSGAAQTGLPSELSRRCSRENRLRRIRETGGSAQYDEAVTRALHWLAGQQNEEGSWGENQKCAMTGLALLAFLARCETPYSEDFGEVTQKAIAYLVSMSYKNRGILSETPSSSTVSYEHAIATYALAEALTFCQAMRIPIPGLADAVRTAGNYITANQGDLGSWYYFYSMSSSATAYPDLSITGWNVQALLAARRTGLAVNGMDEVLKRAVSFTRSMADEQTGMFAYTGRVYRPSMTCVGVLLLQLLGQYNAMENTNGMAWIQSHLMSPDYGSNDWDLYLQYYCAQTMINAGGDPWKKYSLSLGKTLLANQQENGSWAPPPNTRVPGNLITADSVNGRIYSTSMAVLTLTVFYRYQIKPPGK